MSILVRMNRSFRILAGSLAMTFAVALPASAAAPSGTYRGDTSQNRTVHVKVKNGTIKNLSFSVYTRCGIGGSGGGATDVLVVRNAKVKKNGTFKVVSKGDSSNGLATYELVGKVTKKKITGSIEQFFRNGCQTFDLTFSAKRR
jgi:hypothetical protein